MWLAPSVQGFALMCFDADAQPPIPPVAGAPNEGRNVELAADDGTAFTGFFAPSGVPSRARVLILPDVRGLFGYYRELACRFAEAGIGALAIDYFGRTAGLGARDADFDFMPHVAQTTWAGLSADIRTGITWLRDDDPAAHVCTIGFCFGGRLAFDTGALGLGLAGTIGFYGLPVGARNDIPAPVDLAREMRCPVLGLFGGADGAIPGTAVAAFEQALSDAAVTHDLVTYPGAPHSFFDRKSADFVDESADAWTRVLAFIARHSAT